MLEIRTAKLAMTGDKIGGYASVYDAPSHPLTFRGINGGKPFTERVARGAFDSSLGSNISLLVGHDSRDLLASWWTLVCCLRCRSVSKSSPTVGSATLAHSRRLRCVKFPSLKTALIRRQVPKQEPSSRALPVYVCV